MTRNPKFAAGDKVSASLVGPRGKPFVGVFTITRVMPSTDVGFEYRAKSDSDQHERVFEESKISLSSG
jgi:hypothetical protein